MFIMRERRLLLCTGRSRCRSAQDRYDKAELVVESGAAAAAVNVIGSMSDVNVGYNAVKVCVHFVKAD
jgi:hypothetical protein